MTNFHEALFPEEISYGSAGGPTFKTTVFPADSGHEQRNVDWSNFKCKYDVGQSVKSQADMDTLGDFFKAVAMGRRYGFRFKDWADFTVEDQVLGFGDGVTTAFQMTKTYSVTQAESGETYTYTRTLAKIAWDTVAGVTIDESPVVAGVDYFVDHDTGIITFETAPSPYSILEFNYAEFHVPARFDIDKMDVAQDFWETKSWPNIPIVEIRPVEDPTVTPALPHTWPALPGAFSPTQGVHFDQLTKLINALLATVDTPMLTYSIWYRFDPDAAGFFNTAAVWQSNGDEFANYLFFDPRTHIYIADWEVSDSGPPYTGIIAGSWRDSGSGSFDIPGDTDWHHILFSADYSTVDADSLVEATQFTKVLYDGVDFTDIDGGLAWVLGKIIRLNARDFTIGGNAFDEFMLGDMAEFWFAPGVSLLNSIGDLPTGNLRKFRTADGKPVGLGADGSTPTGTAPAIYLRVAPTTGVANDFLTNRGTGGDFTYASGALTLSSTNPG